MSTKRGMKPGSSMAGPLRLTRPSNGLSVQGLQATITVSALTTNTAESYSILDPLALAGDIIVVSPQTAPEVGWGLEYTGCLADGTITVRARNHSGGTLTGGPLVLSYQILR